VSTFVLHLQGATRYERVEHVASFVGEDASGQFGLLAGHERFVTTLIPGLARFRAADEPWQYLALPGAIAYFTAGELYVVTGRYAKDRDYQRMRAALREQLDAEEAESRGLKESVQRLEQEMFRRLYDLERRRAA
jgi:F-type H+-transporting ATPase subunit epsilon